MSSQSRWHSWRALPLSRSFYNAENVTVIYRSRMHAKTKRNFEIFSAEEFIAAITQHIPVKGFQMVRYPFSTSPTPPTPLAHEDRGGDRLASPAPHPP